MKNIILLITLCISVFTCKKKIKEKETQIVNIELSPKNDSQVFGKAKFTETKGVVLMSAIIVGLSEGTHAIHIHEKSDCSSEDGKSTGGHWNPTAQPHGKWGAKTGYHKGDIGNFNVKSSEDKTKIEFKSDQWCIGCGDVNKDILGKAVIVHQGVDDFTSQPSGAAGSRVSCGGIIK
jgi:Cu-Zn family superoxide dismutase|tara:strand:+ start:39722 stop:40252 length:531 start_codon:yes stop_codon:yes gene_type:complete